MVDGGGQILNWLFGISTSEELERVNSQVAALSSETTTIVHAMETHTTLINETLWELQVSREASDATQRALVTLDKDLRNTKRATEDLAREMAWDWQSRDKLDNAFWAVDSTIEWLHQLLDRMSSGLASAAMEKLSPALFPPTQLLTVITDIKNNLPPGWALTPAVQAGDMWKSYQEATVSAAATHDGFRLFIHLPVFEFTRALTLYRVIGMTRASPDGTTGTRFTGLPDYLAASPDQQTFIELSTEMTNPCRTSKRTTCPISRAVSRKNNGGACSVAIFLGDQNRIQQDCTTSTSPWTTQDATAANTTRLVLTCPRESTTAKRSFTVDAPAISIVEVPMACTAQSDDWIFQASFRKDIHRQWITRPAPQLGQIQAPPVFGTVHEPDYNPDIPHPNNGSPRPLANRLGTMTASMLHQLDSLNAQEHARITTATAADPARYPWEWTAALALCILCAAAILVTRSSTHAAHNTATLRRIVELETRIHLHEQATSPLDAE